MSRPPRALPFRLLAVTGASPATPEAAITAALRAGTRLALLLRDPRAERARLVRRVERLLPLARDAGALLLVHADPALALETGADGVHLPERGPTPRDARDLLGPDAWIGASRHDLSGLTRTDGADYVTLSPVFPTPGKGPPLGLDGLRRLVRAAPLPVVALGGIRPGSAAACLDAGASAVAAIRAVWEGDPAGNVRSLEEVTDRFGEGVRG